MDSKSPDPQAQIPTWIPITQRRKNEAQSQHASTLYQHYIFTMSCTKSYWSSSSLDLSVFNIQTFEWLDITLKGSQIKPRRSHSACLFDNNKVIIYGGEDWSAEPAAETSEITILTLDFERNITIDCENKPINPEDPVRVGHSAQVFDNKMYMFGGAKPGPEGVLNELWALDLGNFQWEKCQASGDIPSARFRHSSVIYKNQMFIFGGRDELAPYRSYNDLFSLDFGTLNWSQISCKGRIPRPRDSASIVQNNGLFYVFGGFIDDDNCSSEMFSLDIEGGFAWKLVETKNTPPGPRGKHTSVFYEDKVFIFGGSDAHRRLPDYLCLELESVSQTNNYMEQISKAFMNKEFSDVQLVVGKDKFPVHKVILASRCRYFDELFTGKAEIEILDCKEETFKALLEYIYCDHLNLKEDLAIALLRLANKWRYEELKEYCWRYLGENITKGNVLELVRISKELGEKRIREKVVEFVIENMDEMRKEGMLRKFEREVIVEAVLKLKKETDDCHCTENECK